MKWSHLEGSMVLPLKSSDQVMRKPGLGSGDIARVVLRRASPEMRVERVYILCDLETSMNELG